MSSYRSGRAISYQPLYHRGHVYGNSYDIISLDTIDLAPGSHDPAIVRCDRRNDIYALLAELLDILDVRRQVAGLATGRESTYFRRD